MGSIGSIGTINSSVGLMFTKPPESSMTPKQYADAIDRLGLSQRAAGRFLGVEERTSRRWISGESAIPESAAKLLRLMIARKISPDDVK